MSKGQRKVFGVIFQKVKNTGSDASHAVVENFRGFYRNFWAILDVFERFSGIWGDLEPNLTN